MEISISEENQEQINRKVESGKYRSPDDVIAKALELLNEHDEELAQELVEVRAKVQEGIDQLTRGEFVECTDETLDDLLQEIETEALSDGVVSAKYS